MRTSRAMTTSQFSINKKQWFLHVLHAPRVRFCCCCFCLFCFFSFSQIALKFSLKQRREMIKYEALWRTWHTTLKGYFFSKFIIQFHASFIPRKVLLILYFQRLETIFLCSNCVILEWHPRCRRCHHWVLRSLISNVTRRSELEGSLSRYQVAPHLRLLNCLHIHWRKIMLKFVYRWLSNFTEIAHCSLLFRMVRTELDCILKI